MTFGGVSLERGTKEEDDDDDVESEVWAPSVLADRAEGQQELTGGQLTRLRLEAYKTAAIAVGRVGFTPRRPDNARRKSSFAGLRKVREKLEGERQRSLRFVKKVPKIK